MGNEMSAEQVNSIMAILNSAGSQAVEHYAKWHFVNAIVWLLVGVSMIALAIAILTATYKQREKIDEPVFIIVGCFLAGLIGLLLVGNNITNIVEPTAYAIHQLIVDIRG